MGFRNEPLLTTSEYWRS